MTSDLKVILAIDPGTRCGYVIGGAVWRSADTWNLKPNRHEGGGMRFLRLRRYLSEIFATTATRPDLVVYEEVRRHLGTDAAHIYGGIVAVISGVCEEHDCPYMGVPVGTIKRFATGKGNASKDAMLSAVRERWPETGVINDHEADALALWHFAWAKSAVQEV